MINVYHEDTCALMRAAPRSQHTQRTRSGARPGIHPVSCTLWASLRGQHFRHRTDQDLDHLNTILICRYDMSCESLRYRTDPTRQTSNMYVHKSRVIQTPPGEHDL